MINDGSTNKQVDFFSSKEMTT